MPVTEKQCPKCLGVDSEKCWFCEGLGLVPKNVFYDPLAGSNYQAARKLSRIPLREYARQCGLSVKEVIDREHGKITR